MARVPWDPFRQPSLELKWETWRSRELVSAKPRANPRTGEAEYVTKHGRVIPAETMKREFERVDDPSD